uniref:Uncharacterized protein n=2 Tax=Knipowitschia caucasica TaxID=637954 RepID=A0AAV2LFT8_KNICA
MEQTFSIRRQEIIKTEPPVKDLLERWPALFTERQVYSEFARIASKNIELDFFDSLDRHAARLMEMFQTKKGVVGQKIAKLLQRQNLANDVTEQRRVIIDGLAIILGDDPSEFFKTSSKALMDETTAALLMGVLTVDEDFLHPSSAETFHQTSKMIAIVIEGNIVMNNISDVPQAFCLLFALTYALHLDYPRSMLNTFRCIQSVMLGLGKQTLPPKLLTLKNYLLA